MVIQRRNSSIRLLCCRPVWSWVSVFKWKHIILFNVYCKLFLFDFFFLLHLGHSANFFKLFMQVNYEVHFNIVEGALQGICHRKGQGL